MAWCSMGNEAAAVAFGGVLGMGVAHGLPVFAEKLATDLPWFTLGSFSFQDRRVRDGGEENHKLHSTAMSRSCRIEKVT